jgi:hypothetical protein
MNVYNYDLILYPSLMFTCSERQGTLSTRAVLYMRLGLSQRSNHDSWCALWREYLHHPKRQDSHNTMERQAIVRLQEYKPQM